MTNNNYDAEFFRQISLGASSVPKIPLSILLEHLSPRSFCDVGCGTGGWLAACRELVPNCEIRGFDGSYVPSDQLLIDTKDFTAIDLEHASPKSHSKFDICISIEVAEHLSHKRAKSFVSDLCALSDVVLFSAAVPFQGGVHHINEQWLEYWGILFRSQGYVAFDPLRSRLRGRFDVPYYLRSNMIVFAKDDSISAKTLSKFEVVGALTVLDPQYMIQNTAKLHPFMFDKHWHAEMNDLVSIVQSYLNGSKELPELETARLARSRNCSMLAGQNDFADIDASPLSRFYIDQPFSLTDFTAIVDK